MHHIVEVRHIGHDLHAAAGELRGWLDRHGILPVEFEHSIGGPGITFRIGFVEEEDARTFAETFHGWLNDGVQPPGAARWVIGTASSRTRGMAEQ